jgi:hypothetical protein
MPEFVADPSGDRLPLGALLDTAIGGAEQVGPTLRPDEDWAPVLLAAGRRGVEIIQYDGRFLADAMTKAVWRARMRTDLRTRRAYAAALVTTSWRVTGATAVLWNAGMRTPSGSMGDQPGREEIVGVYAADDTGRRLEATAVIERRQDAHPLLGPWERVEADGVQVQLVGDLMDTLVDGVSRR